jgi:branched-chain amino acid transport system substrate-binding protein
MARSSHDARSTGRRPKRLKARRVRRLSTFYASCNKHSKINQVWNNHSKNEMLSRRWVAGRLPSRQAAWQEETDVSRDHLEGPGADGGKYSLTGAKIALDRVNKAGGVLGKQVELITEDDQTTNPGAVLAFSKLAVQADIVAFLGEVRSTQTHAMAPDILKTGKPVCFGGTDPKLTKMGNPWLIRFRPNDSYSGRVIAAYGVATLGKKNRAIVHSTDAFGTSGFQALSASLDKLGAKIAIDQGYPNQNQDLTPVVLAVKSSGADIIGSYFTFPNDQAIFARQLRQLGVTLPWVGSPTTFLAETVKLASPALWGTYGVADFAIDSSREAKEFAALYSAVSNVQPDLNSA